MVELDFEIDSLVKMMKWTFVVAVVVAAALFVQLNFLGHDLSKKPVNLEKKKQNNNEY